MHIAEQTVFLTYTLHERDMSILLLYDIGAQLHLIEFKSFNHFNMDNKSFERNMQRTMLAYFVTAVYF